MEHPVISELRFLREVSAEHLKLLMRKHGRHPRGIGGLSSYDKISFNVKNNSWTLGPKA